MKVKVYNLEGKETGEMALKDMIFKVAVKPDVVHQVFTALMNNQRQPWADTKNRGEVQGGGKKPWAQKGTGRARHGSIRSPIWKGGGVAFGPLTERNYKEKINRKTRRLAVKMCLSAKVAENNFLVADNFAFAVPKTKMFVSFLESLPVKSKSFLVMTAGKDESAVRMTRNLPEVTTIRAEDVNVMDLLNKKTVVATRDAVEKMENILSE